MLRSSLPLVALAFVSSLAGCAAESPDETSGATESAVTSAAPVEVGSLAGEFRYAGKVEALARLTVDVIDERMTDAATRLEELRRIGATCERKTSTMLRCHKMHPAGTVPASSLAAIGDANAQVFATFGAAWGSPTIETDGDSFKEWSIPVDGTSPAGAFRLYKWRQLGEDGPTKIVLPSRDAAEPLELIVRDASHLGRWASHRVSEGRWRWHEDIALAILEK